MQLSITQFQADIIKQSLKLYNTELLTSSKEWKEIDNLFDKLSVLSDTSRVEDFYKQSNTNSEDVYKVITLNRNGKDLDSL